MNKQLAESLRTYFRDINEKDFEKKFNTYNTLLDYVETLPEGLGKVALRLFFLNKKEAVGGNGEVTEILMEAKKAKAWFIFEEWYENNRTDKTKISTKNRS